MTPLDMEREFTKAQTPEQAMRLLDHAVKDAAFAAIVRLAQLGVVRHLDPDWLANGAVSAVREYMRRVYKTSDQADTVESQ